MACTTLAERRGNADNAGDGPRGERNWTKYLDRIESTRLVFIDGTWTKTNMAPLRHRAPRSTIKAKGLHGRWQTMAFMAALRHDCIAAP